MVVDFEVDATLGGGFYCFFYSQNESGFTNLYLYFFLKKAVNGCGI